MTDDRHTAKRLQEAEVLMSEFVVEAFASYLICRYLFGVTVIAKICQIQLSKAQCSVLVDKAMGPIRWVMQFLKGISRT